MKFTYLILLVLLIIVAGCTQNNQPIESRTPTLQECQIYADSFKQECPTPEPVECPEQKCECPSIEEDISSQQTNPIEEPVTINCDPKPIGEYEWIEGWAIVSNEKDRPPNRNYYSQQEIDSGYYNPCPQLGGTAP